MRFTAKLSSYFMTAAVLALTASSSWATITCNLPITQGNGANAATLAVAANFVTATTDLVTKCQNEGQCNNTAFTICYDSTTNLKTALNSDYSSHSNAFVTYSYFFAADTSASTYDSYNGTGTAWSYAKGIPVFFAYHDVLGDIGSLLTGQSGHALTISDSDLSPYAINTSAAGYIAVAGTGAPYGVKSHAIINSIQSLNPGLPTSIPSYVVAPLYGNIADTFSAVGSTGTPTIKSGFVSKGQICNGIPPLYTETPPQFVYVEFTNSAYLLDQKAILLNSNTAAVALDNYMTTLKSGTEWATFVQSECYQY